MSDKTSLRQIMRQQRQALAISVQRQHEQQLKQRLLALPCLKDAQSIAAYWPVAGEISPVAALQSWLAQDKSLYLPKILPQRQLRFMRYQLPAQWIKNSLGILQPNRTAIAPVSAMQAIILPLLACDKHGNRLGMGGGYYDRALAALIARPFSARPVLIGIAHDFQVLDQLPADDWDVRLDYLITNRRQLRFKR